MSATGDEATSMPEVRRFRGFSGAWAALRLCAVAAACNCASHARADGDAVAIVNGKSISKADMVRVLMDTKGVDVLQQLVLLETARQETRQKNLRVTELDVEREFQDALDRIAKDAGVVGDAATPANKLKALKSMLDQKRISMAEYKIAIERNAHLRKVVEGRLNITEETLRAQFARTHGERRVIRRISIATDDARALNEALGLLKARTDFAEVARKLNTEPEIAARGGEMPPFAFDDETIPAAMRDQVFLMKEGEVSTPLRVELVFHIMKLERIIPPENVRFEDVRGELEKDLRARATDQEIQKAARELFDRANVKVMDPALREKYEEFVRESRAAAAASP